MFRGNEKFLNKSFETDENQKKEEINLNNK